MGWKPGLGLAGLGTLSRKATLNGRSLDLPLSVGFTGCAILSRDIMAVV